MAINARLAAFIISNRAPVAGSDIPQRGGSIWVHRIEARMWISGTDANDNLVWIERGANGTPGTSGQHSSGQIFGFRSTNTSTVPATPTVLVDQSGNVSWTQSFSSSYPSNVQMGEYIWIAQATTGFDSSGTLIVEDQPQSPILFLQIPSDGSSGTDGTDGISPLLFFNEDGSTPTITYDSGTSSFTASGTTTFSPTTLGAGESLYMGLVYYNSRTFALIGTVPAPVLIATFGSGGGSSEDLTALTTRVSTLETNLTSLTARVVTLEGGAITTEEREKLTGIVNTAATRSESITDYILGVLTDSEAASDLASDTTARPTNGVVTFNEEIDDASGEIVVIGIRSEDTEGITGVVVTLSDGQTISNWQRRNTDTITVSSVDYDLYFHGTGASTATLINIPANTTATVARNISFNQRSFDQYNTSLHTAAVENLQESQLSEDVRTKLNATPPTGGGEELSYLDEQKLAQILPVDNSMSGVTVPYRQKTGDLSNTLADYSTDMIPPNSTSASITYFVAVEDRYTLLSLVGSAVPNPSSLEEVDDQLEGYKIYRVVIPPYDGTGIPTDYTGIGNEEDYDGYTLSNLVKVGRDNLNEEVLEDLNPLGTALREINTHSETTVDEHVSVRSNDSRIDLATGTVVAFLKQQPMIDPGQTAQITLTNEILATGQTDNLTINVLGHEIDSDGRQESNGIFTGPINEGISFIDYSSGFTRRLQGLFWFVRKPQDPGDSVLAFDLLSIRLATSTTVTRPIISLQNGVLSGHSYLNGVEQSVPLNSAFQTSIVADSNQKYAIAFTLEMTGAGNLRIVTVIQRGNETPIQVNDFDCGYSPSLLDFSRVAIGQAGLITTNISLYNYALDTDALTHSQLNDWILRDERTNFFGGRVVRTDQSIDLVQLDSNIYIPNQIYRDSSSNEEYNLNIDGTQVKLQNTTSSEPDIYIAGDMIRVIKFIINPDGNHRFATGSAISPPLTFTSPDDTQGITLAGSGSNQPNFTISDTEYPDEEWFVKVDFYITAALSTSASGGGERFSLESFLGSSSSTLRDLSIIPTYVRHTNAVPDFNYAAESHNYPMTPVEDLRTIYTTVQVRSQASGNEPYRLGYVWPEDDAEESVVVQNYVQFTMFRRGIPAPTSGNAPVNP